MKIRKNVWFVVVRIIDWWDVLSIKLKSVVVTASEKYNTYMKKVIRHGNSFKTKIIPSWAVQ